MYFPSVTDLGSVCHKINFETASLLATSYYSGGMATSYYSGRLANRYYTREELCCSGGLGNSQLQEN